MDWLAWCKSKSADSGESENANQEQKTTTNTSTSAFKKTISGPYVSDNLTIFFFHGSKQEKTRQFITLEEALDRKDVVVGETGTVQELKIKNKGKEYVFVQSGDIVKGGKQDRTIQHDMILDPHCEFIPINSFCVEQGRWRQRGNENMTEFSESSHYLSSKSLKMAAKYAGSQSEVWSEVRKMQTLTADSTGVPLSELQRIFPLGIPSKTDELG
ncbi:MAG: hypothetical protein K8F91_08295 [Candidatus Obscuribacterales bacterium]|nr:hypothetical protein [Candidatus Obscuribacterales bacterium]